MIDGKVVWTTDDVVNVVIVVNVVNVFNIGNVVNVVNVVGDDNGDQRRFLASDFSYEKLSVTCLSGETRLL